MKENKSYIGIPQGRSSAQTGSGKVGEPRLNLLPSPFTAATLTHVLGDATTETDSDLSGIPDLNSSDVVLTESTNDAFLDLVRLADLTDYT